MAITIDLDPLTARGSQQIDGMLILVSACACATYGSVKKLAPVKKLTGWGSFVCDSTQYFYITPLVSVTYLPT